MLIKTVILKYEGYDCEEGYIHTITFKQYKADNGNSMYVIGTTIVSREAANQVYASICKNCTSHEPIRAITRYVSDEQIIAGFKKNIDEYVEYIDDWETYRRAFNTNEIYRRKLDEFMKISGRKN